MSVRTSVLSGNGRDMFRGTDIFLTIMVPDAGIFVSYLPSQVEVLDSRVAFAEPMGGDAEVLVPLRFARYIPVSLLPGIDRVRAEGMPRKAANRSAHCFLDPIRTNLPGFV